MNDLENIKAKIKALKKLAKNEAASVGEAANAIKLAKRMCDQYNLILSEINEDELEKELKDNIIEKKIETKHRRVNAAISMSTRICKFFECETFYSYDEEYQTIIGLETDIESALYALDVAHGSLDLAWKKYMGSEEYEDYIYDGFSRSQIRRDFSKGFALAVIDLLKQMQADKDALKEIDTSKCTALIVRKAAEINEYKQKSYPNLRMSQSRISIRLSGAEASGRIEGNKVRFNKGVSQGVNDKCLLPG